MTTPFSDKCQILSDMYEEYNTDAEWEDFFEVYDLGIPLAIAIAYGGASATAKGTQWIDDAWSGLCEMLEIDSHGEYESIGEMIDFAKG